MNGHFLVFLSCKITIRFLIHSKSSSVSLLGAWIIHQWCMRLSCKLSWGVIASLMYLFEEYFILLRESNHATFTHSHALAYTLRSSQGPLMPLFYIFKVPTFYPHTCPSLLLPSFLVMLSLTSKYPNGSSTPMCLEMYTKPSTELPSVAKHYNLTEWKKWRPRIFYRIIEYPLTMLFVSNYIIWKPPSLWYKFYEGRSYP